VPSRFTGCSPRPPTMGALGRRDSPTRTCGPHDGTPGPPRRSSRHPWAPGGGALTRGRARRVRRLGVGSDRDAPDVLLDLAAPLRGPFFFFLDPLRTCIEAGRLRALTQGDGDELAKKKNPPGGGRGSRVDRQEVPWGDYEASLIVGRRMFRHPRRRALGPRHDPVDDAAPHLFRPMTALRRFRERGDSFVTGGACSASRRSSRRRSTSRLGSIRREVRAEALLARTSPG